jgi:NAD(P)-dependent dehydrogenase (short-subunit alcohol dehydrogenase family)
MTTVKKLNGKIALVTGGTRGIGKAIAKELDNQGATVMITGTRTGYTSENDFIYYCVDFAYQDSLQPFVKEIRGIQIDILVNNAGINKIGPVTELKVSDFVRVQKVNVTAPFLLCQAVLPGMRERKWGRIVNISSIWGKISKMHRVPYSASKFAIDGLTAALSAEVAVDGVLVNSVAPGFIDTELTRSVLGIEGMNQLALQVPIQRVGTPEEVAVFVAWLASSANTYISGQNLAIDGGFTRV